MTRSIVAWTQPKSSTHSSKTHHKAVRRQGNSGAGAPGSGDGGQGNSSPQTFDEHDFEGAQELSPDEQRALDRDIDEAIRQGALIAGKMGSGGDRDLQELLQPQVDWREVMRDFITTTCTGNDYSTWRRPNRRFMSSGVYLPSGISERVDELVIATDMSGSIGDREVVRCSDRDQVNR
jgi:predicted metal-dependent peptidase